MPNVLAPVAYLAQCSAALKARYGITTADAGLEDEYVLSHQSDRTPEEFVAWFGEKMDLTPVTGQWGW